jgi:hypothetical protein
MSDREAAWQSLFDALPPRWTVGMARFEVDTGSWSIVAHPATPRGSDPPVTGVTGIGRSETAALRDLTAKLREGGPRGTVGD